MVDDICKQLCRWGGFARAVSEAITCSDHDSIIQSDRLLKRLLKLGACMDVLVLMSQLCQFSFMDRNRANSPLLDQLLQIITGLTRYMDAKPKPFRQKWTWNCVLGIGAVKGYSEAVEFAIERGGKVSWSSMLHACRRGHIKVVNLLLARKVAMLDIFGNTCDNGQTLGEFLSEACERGDIDMASLLLEHGADIHYKKDRPLRNACAKEQLTTVNLLLDRGADVNADDDAAIQYAVAKGNHDLMRLLLERGANIDTCSGYPLRHLCRIGDLQGVKFLLDRGANVRMEMLDGPTEIMQLIRNHYIQNHQSCWVFRARFPSPFFSPLL